MSQNQKQRKDISEKEKAFDNINYISKLNFSEGEQKAVDTLNRNKRIDNWKNTIIAYAEKEIELTILTIRKWIAMK